MAHLDGLADYIEAQARITSSCFGQIPTDSGILGVIYGAIQADESNEQAEK